MEEPTGWQNFLEIVTKADNIPIGGMLLLGLFCTGSGWRHSVKNDRRTEEDKKDEIINKMWE